MASNGGKVQFGVQFKVDKSGLNQMKKGLQDIVNIANKTSSSNPLKKQFDQAAQSAKKLSNILDKSWNSKLGQLNLGKFRQEIQTSKISLDQLKSEFSRMGPEGANAFNTISTGILNTNVQLRQSSKLLDSMATSMGNTIKWGITSSIFNKITGSIQQAYFYAKDLDRSLTDIRIVTGDSADQMERFAKTANTAAKDLGRSTLDYTKAALTFYQQGLDQEQVQARTEATLKAENITGIGSEMADYLTAVWNGFNAGAEDAQLYVDKLAAVADSTASNMGQLATAISKVASAANNVGVDADQLNGQIATVIATTRQAPESVGTAFKTIYARINDIKAGTDQAEISLGNYSGKMAALGINVLDATGHLRDTGEVIEEIGGKWEGLTRQQQINLAQTMAGQRQYNNLIALFDNWDKYLESVNTSMDAQGTLNEKNDRYLESLEAHMQQLGTEAERTYDILFDENAMKGLTDVLKDALSIFNDFIEGLGGGVNAFVHFGSVVAGIFNQQIANAVLHVKGQIDKLVANKAALQMKDQALATGLLINNAANGGVTDAQSAGFQAQFEVAKEFQAVQKGLTQEEQQQTVELQKQIGLHTQRLTKLQQQKAQASQLTEAEQKQYAALNNNKFAVEDALNSTRKRYEVLNNVNSMMLRINTIQMDETSEQEKQASTLAVIEKHSKDIEAYLKLTTGDAEYAAAYIEALKNSVKTTSDWQKVWNGDFGNLKALLEKAGVDLEVIENLHRKINTDVDAEIDAERKVGQQLNGHKQSLLEMAKSRLNTQTAIKGISVAGQALTAIGGGLSTALAQGATAAEKLNGTFTAINGSIGAALTMIPGIGPALNIAWQGVTSIGKAILQATGAWDKFEDAFKSSQERIDQYRESMSKMGQAYSSKSSTISSLQGIKDEWEQLQAKVQGYNGDVSRLSEEEQARYYELTQKFSQYNQAVISGYDEQGRAIVRGQDALQDTIDLLQSAKEEAVQAAGGQIDDLYSGLKETHKKETNEEELINDITDIDDQITALKNSDSPNQIKAAAQGFYAQVDNIMAEVSDSHYKGLKETLNENGESFGDLLNQYQGWIDAAFDENGNVINQQAKTHLDNTTKFIQETLETYEDDTENLVDFTSILLGNNEQRVKELEVSKQQLQDQLTQIQSAAGAIDHYTEEDARTITMIVQNYKGHNIEWKELAKNAKDLNVDQNILTEMLNNYILGFEYNELQDPEYIEQKVRTYITTINKVLVDSEEALAEVFANYDPQTEFQGMTLKQKNKRIAELIQQAYNTALAESEEELSDQAKQALIEYIASFYDVSAQDIIDENGHVIEANVESANQQILKNIQAKIKDSEGFTVGIYNLQDILSEEDIANFDNIFANIDWVHFDELINKGQNKVQAFRQVFADAKQITDDFINLAQVSLNSTTGAAELGQKLKKSQNLSKDDQQHLQALLQQDSELLTLDRHSTEFYERLLAAQEKLQQKYKENLELQIEKSKREEGNKLRALQQAQDQLKTAESTKDYQAIKEAKKAVEQAQADYNTQLANTQSLIYQNQAAEASWANQATNRAAAALKSDMKQIKDGLKLDPDQIGYHQALELVKTDLQELFGFPINNDNWIIQNLDLIEQAAKGDTQALEELKEAVENISGYNTKSQANRAYNKSSQQLSNLNSAAQTLSEHGSLSSDDAQAIASIESQYSDLAALSANRYSQDYLDKLNEIIAAQRTLNEQKRQQARIETQENIKNLNDQKKQLEDQLEEASKITERQYSEAKQHLHDGTDPTKAQQIIDLYEGQEDTKKRIRDIDSQIVEQEGKLIQQEQQDLSLIKDKYDKIEDAQKAILDGKLSEDEYQILRPEILQKNLQALGKTTEQLEEYAKAMKESGQYEGLSQEALEDLALKHWQLDDILQDVTKNFDKYKQAIEAVSGWEETAKRGNSEYIDSLSSLKTAMQELTGLNLSDSFVQSANGLALMQDYINGTEGSLERLRIAALQDIVVGLNLDPNDQQYVIDQISNLIYNDWDKIEVGASLDDTQFINTLNHMTEAGQMTAEQVAAILAGINYQADIEPVDQNIQLKVPSVYWQAMASSWQSGELSGVPTQAYAAMKQQAQIATDIENATVTGFRLKNVTSTKTRGSTSNIPKSSSGGKSGGGGKGKGGGGKGKGGKGNKGNNKNKDLNEDKVQPDSDPYHKVNKQLETLDENLKKITDDREKLTGKDYINNLQQQLEVMKKQVQVQREKMNIARTQRTQAKNFLSQYGAQYDNDGNITNYDNILSKAASAYNKKVDEYNKYTVVDDSKAWDKISKGKSKKWKTDYLKKHKGAEYNISQSFADNMKAGLESAKKTYEKVQDMIDQYEEAEGIVDAFNEKAKDVAERQIEIKIETFTLKINAKLDKASLEQSWNQFLKDIQQDGGLNDVFEDADMNKKNISSITSRVDTNLQAVKDINKQIQTIKQGGESTLFGKEWIDSNGQRQYVTDEASAYEYLKTKVEDLQKSYKELKAARDAIKQDALKSIEQVADAYDKVNDELEFQNDLLKHQQKLIKLTQGEKAFKALDKQYRKSLNNQKQQAAQAREESQYWYNKMNTIADKNSELYQSYYNNYKQAVQNLNDATQNELQILSDLYKNKVDQIIDDWEQKITNGIGLDAISKQWDYVKERSEEVLDDVNKNYQINAFNAAGEEYLQQAEGNLKAQKAIKKVLAEQNQFLKQKQNITQYDIDRANLLLQIEAKRAQLEDANSAKTKLRLRRDSQGNYSYQYVAEDTGVAKAKKQLEELQNELWNFTKNGVQQAQDNVLDAVQSFEQELADIWDKQYQSDEKRQQALDALYAKYSDKISRYVTEIQQRGGQLTDLGIDLLPLLTGASSEYFQGLTPEEQAEYVDRLSGGILTGGGIQAMLNNFLSSGGFDAWFKELNAKFEANKSQWVAESTAATDNETDINAQAQAASQSAKAIAQTNLNTAKSFLDQTVDIYNNVCGAVSALTTQYNQLGDAIKDLAKEGEGLSTLYSWYNEQEEAASGKTTQLVNATAAQNEAAQNAAIITSNPKNTLASYTDQWSQAVNKGNTYSKKIWPQIMESKAFYDDNLLTKAIKNINENNPLLNILNNLGDYSEYINSGMLNRIKDAFTFTQSEIRMLDPNQIRQAYQQSVQIAASFPNVRSEEEIKNALNSMITKASQYIHDSRYTIK